MQHMSLHHTAKRLLFHESECDQTSVREIRELRFEYCLKKDIKCFSNTGTLINTSTTTVTNGCFTVHYHF